jgi:hypothetical protein
MIYIFLVIALAFGGSIFLAYKKGGDAAVADYQIKQEAAQATIDAQAKKLTDATANAIIDMGAAYDAGEANAKAIEKKIYGKGQSYAAATPVFRIAECVVPPNGMLAANGARAGIRNPAAAPGIADAMPAAGADPGRQPANPVPPDLSGRGAVGGVPAPARPVDSGGPIQGRSDASHPKPVVIP